jgi:hypothetical protein
MRGCPACGPSYTPHGAWRGLRGLMAWSANRNTYGDWQFQKNFDQWRSGTG